MVENILLGIPSGIQSGVQSGVHSDLCPERRPERRLQRPACPATNVYRRHQRPQRPPVSTATTSVHGDQRTAEIPDGFKIAQIFRNQISVSRDATRNATAVFS